MQCPSDETLMDNAKESGLKLYASLEPEEKKEKINLMVSMSFSIFFHIFSYLIKAKNQLF